MPRKDRKSRSIRLDVDDATSSSLASRSSHRHGSSDDSPHTSFRPHHSVQLDKYWGDDGEDLDSWLFHVRSVAELEGWTPALTLRHAAVALSCRARTEYRVFLSTADQEVTWEGFEQFLQDQFGPKNPVRYYTHKLMSIQQGSHETVSAYCLRFRRTLLQLQSCQDCALPDLTIVTWFQKGLIAIPSRDDIRQQQEADPLLRDVLDFLKHPECHSASPTVCEILRDTGKISVNNNTGLLMHEATVNGRHHNVPILPPASRSAVMTALHTLPMSGHLGYKKTYHRVRSQFYWKGISSDVKAFVRSCLACQQRKPPLPRHSSQLQLFSASRPFEVVSIDLFGPLPRSEKGNRYVVVMVDRFSRWVELAPIPDATASTVADVFVNCIILRHGCPVQLLSDRGSQFLSGMFHRLSERLGIQKIFTSAYHPQTNGQVERLNRYIAASLTTYINIHQTDWDDYLDAIAFAYRTSFIDSIGNTPFYLAHGRNPCLPTDVLASSQSDLDTDTYQYGLTLTQKISDAYQSAKAHQDSSDLAQKCVYDARHHSVHFDIGSLVFLHSPVHKPGVSPKLSNTYVGPYRILRQLSEVLYEISHIDTGKVTKAHVQRLQPVCLSMDNSSELQLPTSFSSYPVPIVSTDSDRETDVSHTPAVDRPHSVRTTAGIRPARYQDSD